MKASNMISPNGSLELCFDELNRVYRVPLLCIVNPTNLITQSSFMINKDENDKNENDNILSKNSVESHSINLKIRINPGDFNLIIPASSANLISELKQFILEQSLKQVIKKNENKMKINDNENENIMKII